jgi:hypothetical protein
MSEQAKSDAKVQKPSTYYDEPHEVVVDSSLWRWPSTGRSLLVIGMPPFTPPLAKKKTATSARKTRKRQDILVHKGLRRIVKLLRSGLSLPPLWRILIN